MIFLFPRWDMLIPWRVVVANLSLISPAPTNAKPSPLLKETLPFDRAARSIGAYGFFSLRKKMVGKMGKLSQQQIGQLPIWNQTDCWKIRFVSMNWENTELH